ncbi:MULTISPECIES: ATP-binding protein [Brevundimonas]|uniref:ATP-binding protein n=1 Tax=Brevundimonas TaxID=41275 RepID=UPI003209834D
MKLPSGLGRNIAIYMSAVTTLGLCISTVGSYFIYGWLFTKHPDYIDESVWSLNPIDLLMSCGFILLSIALSVAAALQLSKRIARPLSSLALAARQIKNGDLSARASSDDRSLGEATEMVENFNAMAERLENVAEDLATWNASIAHELRTPVTILLGRLQGVADGLFELDPALLASLIKQIEGLARLVEDLRVVSLANSGHLHLRLEVVDMADVVEDLRGVVDPALTEGGFRTVWSLDRCSAECDPFRVRQAVLALIDNARKHATPGLLRVSVEQRDSWICIAISDVGPGLSPSSAQKLFQPFIRGGESGEGSGLGLSVVMAVAEAHGGELRYRPNVELGSTFELRLPAERPDHPTG